MITSYIVDGEHVLEELTGSDSRKATDALCCLTDWIACKGVLCTRREWLEPLEAWSGTGDVEADIALDEFLMAEPRICLDGDGFMPILAKVSCMVGNAKLAGGIQIEDHLKLVECKARDRAKRRADMEGMKPFKESEILKFEEFFRRISWHSKTFTFYDKIWGEKAAGKQGDARDCHKSDGTRKRFAEGFAYLIELIFRFSVWRDDAIVLTINTVPCPNVINDTGSRREYTADRLMRSLVEALQKRKGTLSKKAQSLTGEIEKMAWSAIKAKGGAASPESIEAKRNILGMMRMTEKRLGGFLEKCRTSKPSFLIRATAGVGHDRFLKTDFHSYSFGRGFDILDREGMRELNVYWAEVANAE